jgi:hypothetical protein
VVDPTPLVSLESELAGAEAALAASRAENTRTQRLLAAGENASRKSAETAEAQFRVDEIKLASLKRQARLQWGETAVGDPEQLHAFVDALVGGTAALVRVDLLSADAVTELPTTAKILVLGREQQPIETSVISAAAEADPRTQSQSFILQVDHPPFPLRPGMALTAWLELPGGSRPGFTIPRSAILRHDGRTWVIEQEEEEKFVRKPVTLDSPVESGWFVEEKAGGIKQGDLVVVTGAQALLSEELKAASGAAEEE